MYSTAVCLAIGIFATPKSAGVPAPEKSTSRPASAPISVPLRAWVVCDDDGGRAARVDARQIAEWVAFSNRVFEPAGIRFEFDAQRGVTPLRSTLINDMAGTQDANWAEARAAADEIAAKHAGALVVFFRHGPGPAASGGGFSWIDYNFVVMGGFDDMSHCGHAHLDALAHEIGHYFGLPHTFPQPFDTVEAAGAFLAQHGGGREAFDGDGIADTPPDPSIRATECDRTEELVIGGATFRLPRRNIMSYYDERDTLSPGQIARVRWFMKRRVENGMAMPTNRGATRALEAETAEIDAPNVETVVQPMAGFGCNSWSGGAQRFFHTGDRGHVTLVLPIEKTGRYKLALYATLAPDYGRVRIALDGRTLEAEYDGYGPGVLETGRIELGTHALKVGKHRLTFSIVGKNAESTDYKLGLDCVDVAPAQ